MRRALAADWMGFGAALFLAFAQNAFTQQWHWIQEPKESEVVAITRLTRGGSAEQLDQAQKQIWVWLEGHQVPWNLWEEWFPALMKAGRYQVIADMSLSAVNSRPALTVVSSLLEWRVRALLALNKPTEALAAAKSYFNACDWNQTDFAVRLVALCLEQAHPEDPEIGKRFRTEQSLAAASGLNRAGSGATTTPSYGPAVADSMLRNVRIDASLYESGRAEWIEHSAKFYDRLMYGTILLVLDDPDAAQEVFNVCYQSARTQEELTFATEGVAPTMRAKDGSIGRANAWLTAQRGAVARQ